MADRLYLSYWIRGFTEHNMLRHFEALLRKFPFSRLQPAALLRLYAVEIVEPPSLEQRFTAPERTIGAMISAAREFQHADTALEIETSWDLWRYTGEWRLLPASVTLSCYGPLFLSELGEHLRIDFGFDTQFLPSAEHSSSPVPVRHNIRALLHLVEDLDESLAVSRRQLWSESGGNFADRLQQALAADR